MNSTAARVIAGFLAGALAVLIFHQGMYFLIQTSGALPLQGTPWRMTPVPPYSVPWLINRMFWGGLWGIPFGLLYDSIPGPPWLRGNIFGLLGPMLLGSWLLVPLLKGQPIMAGWAPPRMLISFLLDAVAFGLGLTLLYPWLKGMLAGKT